MHNVVPMDFLSHRFQIVSVTPFVNQKLAFVISVPLTNPLLLHRYCQVQVCTFTKRWRDGDGLVRFQPVVSLW